MNYKLAKSLKDAGFPITGVTWSWKIADDGTDKEHVPNPTLVELIEACGEDFSLLIRKNGGWQADSNYILQKDNSVSNYSWIGLSPEEAVANLWLHLNKKP